MNSLLSVSIAQQDYSMSKKQKNRKGTTSKVENGEEAFEIQVQQNNYVDVDPNEPVYCVCRQVAFGRMIGCDNEGCKYEWFHWECVGMREPEPEEWWCDECRPTNGETKGNELSKTETTTDSSSFNSRSIQAKTEATNL